MESGKFESGKFESGKFESVSGSSARTSEIDIGSERGELYSLYIKQGFWAQLSNFPLSTFESGKWKV